ncbi:MAG: type II toxin-antitoxin system VapC family toxin [Haloarculaceae archaeon]
MSVFVDTGVFFAHHDTDAERHGDAVAALDAVLDGEYGQPYTSDYILDETVTLTRVRTGSFEAAETVAERIRGEPPQPDVIDMLHVDPDDVAEAMATFRRYSDHDISFTDAMTIHLCESRGIEAVLSFDTDFDGVIDRVDPTG